MKRLVLPVCSLILFASAQLSADISTSMALWNAYVPTLTKQVVVSTFTPDTDIFVTRMQAQVLTAPEYCFSNAVLEISNGTISQRLTITGLANDSGFIGPLDFSVGVPITLSVSVPAGCLIPPSSVNVSVLWHSAPSPV